MKMFSSTTSSLNTQEDLDTVAMNYLAIFRIPVSILGFVLMMQIKKFMESKTTLLQSAKTSSNNIQSVVAANVQWMQNNYDTLNEWFASKGHW